jgi:hypothetical protein
MILQARQVIVGVNSSLDIFRKTNIIKATEISVAVAFILPFWRLKWTN